jgi:hypothetical protein
LDSPGEGTHSAAHRGARKGQTNFRGSFHGRLVGVAVEPGFESILAGNSDRDNGGGEVLKKEEKNGRAQ